MEVTIDNKRQLRADICNIINEYDNEIRQSNSIIQTRTIERVRDNKIIDIVEKNFISETLKKHNKQYLIAEDTKGRIT